MLYPSQLVVRYYSCVSYIVFIPYIYITKQVSSFIALIYLDLIKKGKLFLSDYDRNVMCQNFVEFCKINCTVGVLVLRVI